MKILLLSMLCAGCVADSISYNADTHVIEGHRVALFTNIGSLNADVKKSADGISANINETNVDQTTAMAQALAAMAQALAIPK